MKLSAQRKSRWRMPLCTTALLLLLAVNQPAQTTQLLPAAPASHVNDFAGVVDEKTKQQLEDMLANVKLKTGIEFDIATVQSTGSQDIFDFSRQLAKDWNIGARTSPRKSLLLVVSVNDKASFTQFSKSVQNDLPEGVLGEMGQVMRGLIDGGKFSEGVDAGVRHFVASLGRKLAFSADDLDKQAAPIPSSVAPEAPDNFPRPTDVAAPAITTSAKTETGRVAVRPTATRSATATTKTKSTIDDEDESEEVELTLTKPLQQRVAILKAFLEGHPESKSRDRAIELLVSAHAALGDDRLKKGDTAGGIEQFRLAIADASASPSEKLFAGVISQIPLNLYLRGERAAATKAAQDIEAKFGSDPKRLVILAGFYISTEQAPEALRLATQAVQLAPDLADAHYWLGLALHIALRLDEAAAEYKRALELDPISKPARRSLADLSRASGKAEEALALYRQQLEAESTDKAARTGLVLSLLDLGRADEAKTELDKALQTDPRNLNLLAGVAYWFAAHNDGDSALTYAYKAVQIEPRYTWAQVALARALVAQKKPVEAERAVRFARQYGKFPTLDYELANALAAAGLYEEASEMLMQSFTVKEGQIETKLGGQAAARNASFIELLALERRASIFQPVAADTENNAKLLKALLTFTTLINEDTNGGKIDEERTTAAAKEFASGDDAARVYRQLYAASRLLQKGVGYQTAYELAEAARTSAEAGLNVPALTLAVQADEFRVIRARAIAAGGTPEIPDAPRNVLSNLLRGRVEDISGWALFNEDKLDKAVEHLKRAVTILPEGTPSSRTSLWHLGVALERQDKKAEALSYYIKSFNAGEPDPVRRAVIEQLYRKVNGSLDGLDERIGPSAAAPASVQTAVPNNTPEKASDTAPQKTSPDVPVTTPEATSSPEASSAGSASTAAAEPTPSPEPTTTPDATPTPSPTAASESRTTPTAETSLGASPVEKMGKPTRATVVINGQVKDAAGDPIANVVVVLISPQGTVLASTTDAQGNYSFTVAPSLSTRSYRVIPSKEGLTFEPVDKVLVVANEDQKDLNFVGAVAPKP